MTAIARFVERVINRRTRHYIDTHRRPDTQGRSAVTTTRKAQP